MKAGKVIEEYKRRKRERKVGGEYHGMWQG